MTFGRSIPTKLPAKLRWLALLLGAGLLATAWSGAAAADPPQATPLAPAEFVVDPKNLAAADEAIREPASDEEIAALLSAIERHPYHQEVVRRLKILGDLDQTDTARRFKAADLIQVQLPAGKAAFRAWRRFRGGAFRQNAADPDAGRFVSPRFIATAFGSKPAETYAALKRHPAVVHWLAVDTSRGRGQPPKIEEEGPSAIPSAVKPAAAGK